MTHPLPVELFAARELADQLEAPAPDGFDLARWIEVRFGDTDMMGHVNNSAYATYFEALRFFCLTRLSAPDELTVARVEINFRRPVRFGEPVLGAIRVDRCGARSVELSHALSVDGTTVADGRSVLVAVSGDESTALSDELRAATLRIRSGGTEEAT